MSLEGRSGSSVRLSQLILASTFGLILLVPMSIAQTPDEPHSSVEVKSNEQLQVNWLYGAYVPKDVLLQPLSNHQRFQLFLRQSFTTPGVYLKTAFFSLSDQASNSPPEWGDGFGGYATRTGSRYGQFVTQNALAALGNGLLGYEPRYNRCRCTGFLARTRHAFVRNFVTYDRTEQHLRPQLGMYAGAFGAGVIAGTWAPANPDLVAEGYQGVVTQVIFGVCANWLGEFAPDFKRMLQKNKSGKSGNKNSAQ
jgi:hypothetical protein